MSDRQIEAVFGHEAGHVRHHHIQYFGLFAIGSMMFVSGVMEVLFLGSSRGWLGVELGTLEIQGIGLVLVAIFWGLGFGWVSRRFERQADWFGAQCVTPLAEACGQPCSVHWPVDGESDGDGDGDGEGLESVGRRGVKGEAGLMEGAVCASAAELFSSALMRVADLNGIPPAEPRSLSE